MREGDERKERKVDDDVDVDSVVVVVAADAAAAAAVDKVAAVEVAARWRRSSWRHRRNAARPDRRRTSGECCAAAVEVLSGLDDTKMVKKQKITVSKKSSANRLWREVAGMNEEDRQTLYRKQWRTFDDD